MYDDIGPLIKYTVVEKDLYKPEELVPERKSDYATGFDLKAARVVDVQTRRKVDNLPVTIKPFERVLVGVGIKMAVPMGIDAQIRPRSGVSTKSGVILANSIGTIDADYRGEAALSLLNLGDKPFEIKYGDRLAQLVFTKILIPEFEFVKDASMLPETKRGIGGFGSTGLGASEGFGTKEYWEKIREIDEYMMRIVLATAERSNCVRGCKKDKNGRYVRDKKGKFIGQKRKLGCVFADGDIVIASGFNTQYPGSPLCSEAGCLRDELNIPSGTQIEVCRAIHAEEMAIISAARKNNSVVGSTMYCNAEPCKSCAKKIASLGIKALVVLEGGYSSTEGLQIVRDAGIRTRSLSM